MRGRRVPCNEKARIFFSEEKNQKTFISWQAARSRPWPPNGEPAEKQKSFASFLQKRRFFLTLLTQPPAKLS
jgi:hypothetical protein